MFSGIGGFELGISRALPEAECVGFSEIDKYAIQIYLNHFPSHINYGDATRIDPSQIPDFDLLVGGFPCQAFSIAGKRRGFDDTRGTLFFDIARILKEKRPRFFLLENVKGLLSHDDGRTFKTIISTLVELGYSVEWQVLNSKNFGVPQNRERVFIIGYLGRESRPKVFPLAGKNQVHYQQVGLDIATCLDSHYYKGTSPNGLQAQRRQLVGTPRTHKDGEGFREAKSGLVPTIPARAREDGSGQAVIIQRARGFNKGGEHRISPTLGSNAWQQNNHLTQGMRIRRLTPIECERLQGFPDRWTEGISDTQRYKCLGNAVTVNVTQYLTSLLLGA
jgi:DNA (cytosine-5)-methyltransferase 1